MGRLPQNPKLKARARHIKNDTKAKLSAETEWNSTVLGRKKWVRDSIRKLFADMGEKIDPLELGAMVITTYLVKQGIEVTEELNRATADMVVRGIPFASIVIETLGIPTPSAILKALEDQPEIEVVQWLISFVIAFIFVRHPEVIGQIAGGLMGYVKFIVGIGMK